MLDYSTAIGPPLAPPPDPFAPPQAAMGLVAEFYMEALQDEAASAEQGRAIFRDIEFVRITSPGDRLNVLEHPVTQKDRATFPREYANFRAGMLEDEQMVGTPIKEWPPLTKAQVKEMLHMGIKTVDQLAELRDDVCGRVPGLMPLKQKAKVWLDKAKGAAESTRLDKAMANLQNDNESLRKALAEQAEMLADLRKAKQ